MRHLEYKSCLCSGYSLLKFKNTIKILIQFSYHLPGFYQRIVESIFGEIKFDEDIILPEKYSSSDESDEYKSKEIKTPKPKYSSELQGYQKVHVPENGNCLFHH